MARWREREPKGEMLSVGVDVARGGRDNTVLAFRHRDKERGHDFWFDELLVEPGTNTPDGHRAAALALSRRRDHAPIHIDVIGVGSSPYDILKQSGVEVVGVNASEKATRTDRSGRLTFFNLRSQLWWAMREALDPAAQTGIALPPDPELLKELTAPRWTMSGAQIKVESREDVIERVGRSPDRATAVILALVDTPKRSLLDRSAWPSRSPLEYDPLSRI